MQTMRPYQEECLRKSDLARAHGVTRQLWVLATGLGKTSLVGEYVRRNGAQGTMGLMHREELIDQSLERLQMFSPDATIEIEKADRRATPSTGGLYDVPNQVIISSVQTVGRHTTKSRLPRPEWLRLLWIDEFHHASADGYLRVLDHFGLRETADKKPRRDAMLIGTTATPDRADGLGYSSICDDVVFRYDLPDAIRDGWLADIHAFRIDTDVDLKGVKTVAGDYNQSDLAERVEKSNLTARAIQTWEQHGRGKSSIFFCVDKEHARGTRDGLEAIGAIAAVVTDDTPKLERRAIVDQFKAGEIECLVNCAVFTEGFDAPGISAVYMLRPTKSRSLYMQCLGRGTRLAPGKTHLDLFDCTPRGIPAATVTDIFGLPDAWDLAGQSLTEDKQQLVAFTDQFPCDVTDLTSVKEMQTTKKRIELFKTTLCDKGLTGSRLSWMRAPGADCWRIGWRNPSDDQVSKLPPHIAAAYSVSRTPPHLGGHRESIALWQNEIGKWELTYHAPHEENRMGGTSYARQRDAVAVAEEFIERSRSHVVPLLRKDRGWRMEPASDKQVAALKRRRVPDEMLAIATKAEASALMDMTPEELVALFRPGRVA